MIEELPPSFEDLCRLKDLDLIGCSMLNSLPRSICKWKSLEKLTLLNCSEIDKLPDDIGALKFLEVIDAGGTAIRELLLSILCFRSYSRLRNSFGSIPVSIVNLSNLMSLSIRHCYRLKVLPKLPWTSITADNCTSLEKLPCLPFQNDTSALRGRIMQANFINCFKLDRNSINVFVENIRRKIQDDVAGVTNFEFYEVNLSKPPASVCYPGSEIPEWFDIRSGGSSINVNLSPYWINNFVYFALSAVVAIPDHQHVNSKLRFSCVVIGFRFHFQRKLCGNEFLCLDRAME
ncbi:hypothetical protein Dsin_032691 [Dipteronia sinensis]|uniref:C-JID domain-containing protein n=1 Tax=Dipteronia sinensis TaxID=43782 RepID=A0AAD9Z644_9ROSI|nr:hypothetical protein Dsin_032691 [Dipteronia sinensis]